MRLQSATSNEIGMSSKNSAMSGKSAMSTPECTIESTVLSSVESCMLEDNESQGSFQSPGPVFGRSDEVLKLEQSYLRVKNNKAFEKVIVHGESGTGKTSLVLALQKSVLLENGFFCSGKYFLNSEQDPYSAIMTAFSDLCDLVLQSDGFNEERRATIEKGLGSDGCLLVSAVSNISPFLGDKKQDEHYGSLSQQSFPFARFKVACKKFIQAMTSDDCPVVLFIDDIQWIDSGSKQLLEAILQDKSIKNFMLIMAYREEDASLLKDDFLTIAETDVDLKLGDLDLVAVREMVSETLLITSNDISFDVDDFCRIVIHKTHGNPFHILNFLEMITEDGLLTFDDELSSWSCDVVAIEKNTMIPDSLADIITKKIKRLHKDLQEFLKLVSFIGYRFTYEMIFDIAVEKMPENGAGNDKGAWLNMFLRSAIEANVIEETSDGYQFTHDKLQGAFQQMINKNEKDQLHLKIGTSFLKKNGEVFKYLAAIHLNSLANNTSNHFDDRILLAKTNLQASKYCECRYAFVNAADFLRKGLALLGHDEHKWTTDFDLAFQLTESLARMEFILGNMDACIHANHDILHRAKSEKAKINALSMEIDTRIACDTMGTIEAEKEIFRKLGIKVPFKLTAFHLLSKLKRVRKLIDSKSDTEILNMQHMDHEFSDTCKVMLRLGFRFVQKSKYLWVFFANLLTIEYTMVNGLSPLSANVLCYYGICEKFIMRNTERSYRLGRLALQLGLDIPCKDAGIVNICSALFLIWQKEHLRTDIILFTPEHLNDGLGNGIFASAVLQASFAFFARFWAGEHLTSLEVSMREIHDRLSELGQKKLLLRFQPLIQLILNFQNESEENFEDLVFLTGDVMDETEYRENISDASPPALRMWLWFCKMILAHSLGFNRTAELLLQKIHKGRYFMLKNTVLCLPVVFYTAMISYARYRETRKRRYIRQARASRKKLETLSSSENPNATPYLRVVEAEEYSLKPDDPTKVRNLFDRAIQTQIDHGFAHLEALVNERACDSFFRFGYQHVALRYLDAAKLAYRDKWGATMKYEWLISKYDE